MRKGYSQFRTFSLSLSPFFGIDGDARKILFRKLGQRILAGSVCAIDKWANKQYKDRIRGAGLSEKLGKFLEKFNCSDTAILRNSSSLMRNNVQFT